MQTEEDAAGSSDGFKRIVLCVDSSEASRYAANFARRLATGAEVTIAAVAIDPYGLAPHAALSGLDLGVVHSQVLEDAQRAIAESSGVLAPDAAVVRTRVIDLAGARGDVAHALATEARSDDADLMILGTGQRHGLLKWLEPSVTDALSKIAPSAIVVVPEGYDNARQPGVSRILFAVDGSAAALAALTVGARMITPHTQIRVVYVIDRAVRYSDFVPVTLLEDAFIKEGEWATRGAAHRLEAMSNVTRANIRASSISTDISADDVPHALLREADRWNADLIVMGTHGRRGVARAFFGSVANRVASLSTVPVMLVREPEVKENERPYNAARHA